MAAAATALARGDSPGSGRPVRRRRARPRAERRGGVAGENVVASGAVAEKGGNHFRSAISSATEASSIGNRS